LGQWQALLRLSRSFLASSRPGELAFDAASTLATALRVPMVAVWLRGEDGKLQRKALIGQQDVPPETTDDGIEPSARIARIDRRTELSRRFLGWNETGFLIPIGEASPIRGVIVLVEPVGPLGQDDFELVAAAAGLLASACERADADEAVRASQRLDVTSQLLSGVAHDFNNLITAISSNTDIALGEVPPDGMAAECLQEVVSAAQNAAVLTGRLGAWARPEPLAPARLELSGVLRQNVRLLANLLGKRVQLGIDPGPRGSEVMVDRNDLEQILYNLVLSARNAGPELPNRVDVKVVQGADEVSIVVIDDGPGHASDARSQLYEPFPTPTRGASRASLALATVRRLAARAAGRVTIEGGPKATHVVRVRFPRLAEAPAPVVTTPPARRRVRVLLVDDSAPARIAGANALRSGGHHVVEAEDPRAVLETWDNHTDVLVTDLQMRGLSGAELAAAVTARGWHGPILFCTGHPTEAPPLEPGRTALLAKPYTRKEMLQAVDALLGAVAA
jgi:signal transduction histidine kinase